MTFMFRYHFRILANYLRWRRQGKPRASVSRLTYKATALDCDVLDHINNARYLEFFDSGRTDILLLTGLAEVARKDKIHFVVGGVQVRYRKEVKRGVRFVIESRFDRFEGKALVFSHKLFVGETLCTESEASILVIKDKKVVSPDFLRPLLEQRSAGL